MLEAREIDALISADVPECMLQNSPKVTRLFPDYETVEREYYQRTGILPIMHTVVIRQDTLNPSLLVNKPACLIAPQRGKLRRVRECGDN